MSSAILFRASLCNRVLSEKAISQITNMEHISIEKSLKRGQFPGCPLGCGSDYPSIISKCFPIIPVVFPVCLLVFVAVL